MLVNELVRTKFSDGLRMHYSVFEKNDTYLENKFKILSLGGLGYGVLQGYQESLSLSIEGNLLVIKSGAAIDKYGNLIFIPKTVSIQDKINIIDFADKQHTYVYIKYKEDKGNLQPHAKPDHGEVHTEYINSYSVEVTNYKHHDSEWIELGRISIDYTKLNQYGQDTIMEPLNPFLPRENEVDVRYVPKIVTNLMNLKEEDNERIYSTLGGFADYLNEMAFKYRLFSASTASSFVYQAREDIYTNIITPYDFYQKLKTTIDVVYRIKDENEKIQETDFWKNIIRLRDFFSIGFGKVYSGKISFYDFNIFEKTYFGGILKHFDLAGQCSRDLNFDVQEEVVEEVKHKGYVQVGRSDKEEHGNDIIFKDDKTLSRVHLVVTAYKGGFFIEDKSANGTFVNAQKIEKGVKQFVKPSDEIVLGRNGTKLNLNEQKIQDLLNL